jgi:hypothetical protein
MSHSSCRHREHVDSWLLVVGSQIANLTLGPSFAHNLGCICPNGSCEAILNIYISRPFQWHQENPSVRCFDPYNRALSFRESERTPTSHFWECEFHLHTYPKVGLQHIDHWFNESILLFTFYKHFLHNVPWFNKSFLLFHLWIRDPNVINVVKHQKFKLLNSMLTINYL